MADINFHELEYHMKDVDCKANIKGFYKAIFCLENSIYK